MNEESEDHAQYVAQICGDLMVELDGRLTEKPSDRDHLAIITAVMKAAQRGFFRGVASHASEANEIWGQATLELRRLSALISEAMSQLPEGLDTRYERPAGEAFEFDAWAERYTAGDDA